MVDQEFGELVKACSGLGVAVSEFVEPGGDLVEAGAEAVLSAFEEVEGDRVGVVSLDEFEAFGFELVALGGQEIALVLAGSFELVEYVVEYLPDVLHLGLGQVGALVGAFDLGFDAFSSLAAELRRAEACNHNVDSLLPRLIKARGFADADDIDFIIHYRLAQVTARPAGSGRTRRAPRLIAGMIPEAAGPMTSDMQRALTERCHLIETRAEAVLDTALQMQEPWAMALGPIPAGGREWQQWRRRALVVAAIPRPLPDHRPGTARHPAREYRV